MDEINMKTIFSYTDRQTDRQMSCNKGGELEVGVWRLCLL